MSRQTTVEEREIVILNSKNGKTVREISEIVNKKKSTVFNIIKRFKEAGRIQNKPKNAESRRKISARDGRFILRKIQNDPLLSAIDLQKMLKDIKNLEVSAETVRRFLRNNNFNGRVARKKPLISEKNRLSRLQFAKEHADKDMTFWSKVSFFFLVSPPTFDMLRSFLKGPLYRRDQNQSFWLRWKTICMEETRRSIQRKGC